MEREEKRGTRRKKKISMICIIVVISAVLLFYAYERNFWQVSKTQTQTQTPCPDLQVRWSEDGHCYYMDMAVYEKPIGLTNTTTQLITGKVTQITKNLDPSFTIMLESGQSYNLSNLTDNFQVDKIITIQVIKHDYTNCIVDYVKLANGTNFEGEKAKEFYDTHQGLFARSYDGYGIHDELCSKAQYITYQELNYT